MPLDWAPFVDLVRRHQRFLLTTHVRPDGDGLGSMLALAGVLEGLGKEVRMTVASVLPPRYDFLDPGRRVRRFAPPGAESRGAQVAAVAMDTGWFRHSNATAATFELASALVAAGARPAAAYESLFEQNTLARQKLTGLVLQRLELAHGGQVAHTEIRLADYEATGAV